MQVQGSCGTIHMASRAQEIRETLPLVMTPGIWSLRDKVPSERGGWCVGTLLTSLPSP